MHRESLSIGVLAKETGAKVETIRYYERIGLLATPERTGGNYRAYTTKDLDRLSFIRRARDLGFGLNEVRELLNLADQKKRSCEAVDGIARAHLEEVDRKLEDLTTLRRELNSIIKQCGHGAIENCRIIEALAPARRVKAPNRHFKPSPTGKSK